MNFLLGALLVGGVMWAIYTATISPVVYPESCWDDNVRDGQLHCPGPCQKEPPYPCTPTPRNEVRG